MVYEQPEEGSGKKEKKKGPGIRVPKHTGFAVTMVVIVLAAAVLSFDSFYTLSEEEMAVVTTFGKPAVEEASGLHFKIPVIQRVTKVSKAITGMQLSTSSAMIRRETSFLSSSSYLQSARAPTSSIRARFVSTSKRDATSWQLNAFYFLFGTITLSQCPDH